MRNDPEQNPLAMSYGGKVSVASLKDAIPSQVPYQVCAALFWGGVGIAAALRTRVGLSPLVIALYVAGVSGGFTLWLLLLRRLGPRAVTAAIYQPWCWPFFLWLWFGPPRRPAPWWRWLVWGATIPTFVTMMWIALRTGNG